MRINELLVENQQIDELSLAGAVGSAAKGAANVVGGVKGAWAGAKDVFNQRADRVANIAQRNVQKAAGYKAPTQTTTTPSQQATQPATTNAAPAPTGTATATPPASGTAPAQNTATPTTTPAPTGTATPPANTAGTGRLGIPAGRQAVDQAVATIKAVRSDRRPQVVAYGLQQLGAVKESNLVFHSNFLGKDI